MKLTESELRKAIRIVFEDFTDEVFYKGGSA